MPQIIYTTYVNKYVMFEGCLCQICHFIDKAKFSSSTIQNPREVYEVHEHPGSEYKVIRRDDHVF